MASSAEEPDSTQLFLLHCGNVLKEARFVQQSIPNVDDESIERVLRQLHSIHTLLDRLVDPWLTRPMISQLVGLVLEVASPLQSWRDRPASHHSPPTLPTARGKGHPKYVIDLNRAIELHNMGLSWDQIAKAMGISRRTLYYHLQENGLSTQRLPFTEITDIDLNTLVADISSKHPLSGSVIVRGHLKSMGVHVSASRVQESLRCVDAIGVSLRWNRAIKRRVYRVRGSNALWHQDGNEKLRPWGFYVHGCIDGHSRLIIYLKCSSNKRSLTVEIFFMDGVAIYGWPSRVRGDFGTENNGIEARMIEKWGEAHRAYLRGRSIHNVRIERLWRDVRRDSLEFFRSIFIHLENIGLLDMECPAHRISLFLVYHHRIQQSLDETVASWNLHKLRTAGNKSPQALFQLSREQAINQGYWTGDPGDDLEDVAPEEYGRDPDESFPPADELEMDPNSANYSNFSGVEQERDAGLFVNEDEEIKVAKEMLAGVDLCEDDGNFGIDVYCRAVATLQSFT